MEENKGEATVSRVNWASALRFRPFATERRGIGVPRDDSRSGPAAKRLAPFLSNSNVSLGTRGRTRKMSKGRQITKGNAATLSKEGYAYNERKGWADPGFGSGQDSDLIPVVRKGTHNQGLSPVVSDVFCAVS